MPHAHATIQRYVDAYAHIGPPRFGSAADVIGQLDQWSIDKAVLVLGPSYPSFDALIEARGMADERVRLIGIPFGDSPARRREAAQLQLDIGIIGMRLMPFEMAPALDVLDMLGEAGLWLFAINLYDSADCTQRALDWLQRHPRGRIAAPHFLKPTTIDRGAEDPARFRELLHHDRFHVIASRHGGTGSVKPYPHEDLRPWLEEVAALVTWDRLMWGSEFPVLHWRDERVDEAQAWIDRVGVELTESQRQAFLYGNAQRLFFDPPAPPLKQVAIPDWISEGHHKSQPVSVVQKTPLNLDPYTHELLLRQFTRASKQDPSLRLSDTINAALNQWAATQR